VKNKLSRLILDEIEKSDKIKVASTTIDIVGFPEVQLGDPETVGGKASPEKG